MTVLFYFWQHFSDVHALGLFGSCSLVLRGNQTTWLAPCTSTPKFCSAVRKPGSKCCLAVSLSKTAVPFQHVHTYQHILYCTMCVCSLD